MALTTKTLSRTGAARRIELEDDRDNLERLEAQYRQTRLDAIRFTCQRIRNLLSQEEYDAWWDSTSAHRFGDQAEKKLAALTQSIDGESK
jgi:hypothetical protein